MDIHAFPDLWLTTLDALKLHRGISDSTTPQDGQRTPEEVDALLTQCILDASASIVDEINRLPLPYHATIRLPAVRDDTLYLSTDTPNDLLDLIEVLDEDAVLVTTDEFAVSSYNTYPKDALTLIGYERVLWATGTAATRQPLVTLEGIFGYVPHWARAWKSTGQVLPTGGIDDEAEACSLSDVSAIPIGAYGRLDDEYVQFLGRDLDAGIVTLARGVLGTEPDEHSAGVPVELFRHHTDIQTKCTEWAAFLYKSLDQLGEEVKVFNGGTQFVRGLSPLVKQALAKHKFEPLILPGEV